MGAQRWVLLADGFREPDARALMRALGVLEPMAWAQTAQALSEEGTVKGRLHAIYRKLESLTGPGCCCWGEAA